MTFFRRHRRGFALTTLVVAGAALGATTLLASRLQPHETFVQWLLAGGALAILAAMVTVWRFATVALIDSRVAAGIGEHNAAEDAHQKAIEHWLDPIRDELAEIKRLSAEARDAATATKVGHDTLVRDGLCPALAQIEEARSELNEALRAVRESRPRRATDAPDLSDSAIHRLRSGRG